MSGVRLRDAAAAAQAAKQRYEEALQAYRLEMAPAIAILHVPLAGRAATGLFSDTARAIIEHVRERLAVCDEEGLFMANPSLRFGGAGVTILHGHAQLGKSRAMCELAWIAHFVHGVVPIVFTKLSGGLDAKMQLRRSIESFNSEIDVIVRAWAVQHLRDGASGLAHELERFHLVAVDKFASCHMEKAQVGRYSLNLLVDTSFCVPRFHSRFCTGRFFCECVVLPTSIWC